MQKRFISIALLLSLLSIYLPPPQHAEAALLTETSSAGARRDLHLSR
jgi:hypothetical protein